MKPSDCLKPWRGLLLGLLLSCSAATIGRSAPALSAGDLRCEYGRKPTAVGETQPRLSWVVEAGQNRRAVTQAGYRLLVAGSLEALRQDRGDAWDSGKVSSDQNVQVVYDGKPLSSGQTYYWKVMIWDRGGHASPWSDPSQWTMGLRKSDWQAQWIGYQPPLNPTGPDGVLQRLLVLDDCPWMWANGAKPGDQPAGRAFFRRVITLPAGRALRKASFLLAADDSFRLYVNGQPAGEGNSWKTVSHLEITDRLQPGANALTIEATNGGDSPSPAGVIGPLGPPL